MKISICVQFWRTPLLKSKELEDDSEEGNVSKVNQQAMSRVEQR